MCTTSHFTVWYNKSQCKIAGFYSLLKNWTCCNIVCGNWTEGVGSSQWLGFHGALQMELLIPFYSPQSHQVYEAKPCYSYWMCTAVKQKPWDKFLAGMKKSNTRHDTLGSSLLSERFIPLGLHIRSFISRCHWPLPSQPCLPLLSHLIRTS